MNRLIILGIAAIAVIYIFVSSIFVVNALLLYNGRDGEFINGVTGLTTRGEKPAGFHNESPTRKMTWGQWKGMQPSGNKELAGGSWVMPPRDGATAPAPRTQCCFRALMPTWPRSSGSRPRRTWL